MKLRSTRGRSSLATAAYVALVYVPILRMDPRMVEADTKTYLYLDPARFLARAASVWDPQIAMGTLSHQTLGYLFPMGPFYWFFQDVLGVPAWVAQRLWLGTIIVAAGFGVRYLLRGFGIRGVAVGVAMLAYSFTPYVLGYAGIYSALLMPWAALPWWIAFAQRALLAGSDAPLDRWERWRYPALFALSVQVVGSVNGSALMFALLGPALWVVFAIVVQREATWRAAWRVAWRTGLLTVAASLWWFLALAVEGRFGVNILRFTESIETVSATSYPFEVVRGLGNWFFYGGDSGGYWVSARPWYTQRLTIVFVSLLIPALAVLSAALLRWRYRAYFVVLALVGIVISVGASPYDDPSILGGVYKEFALRNELGFALRNSGRALPLMALSFAVFLGLGAAGAAQWLRRREHPRLAVAASGFVVVLCLVNAVPMLTGGYYNDYLQHRSIPRYWQEAIAALDAEPNDTRVLAIPGSDFAAYRWGDTRDPIEPGFMDRPYVARELIPWGTPPSLNLLRSLDRRIQERSLDTRALAPIARLMGVGTVLVRSDLQTDRFSIIPAKFLWRTLTDPQPEGIGAPTAYGDAIPGRLQYAEVGDLTRPADQQPNPPPVATMAVDDPVPIVRAKPAAGPLVVSGDGEGLLDLATVGLLDPSRLVVYSGSLDADAVAALPDDAVIVLTDSHRRRGQRWAGLDNNDGYTEVAGEEPMRFDALDQRLDVFEGTGIEVSDDTRSVAELGDDVAMVRATTYGESAFGYSPGARPALAFDGDIKTAWTVASGRDFEPETIELRLARPVTTDHLDIAQYSGRLLPTDPPPARLISRISIFADGERVTSATLEPKRSVRRKGQRIEFPSQTFRTLSIRLDAVSGKRGGLFIAKKNAVGLSEVRLRDATDGERPVLVRERIRMPRDLVDALGSDAQSHPMVVVASRESTMDGVAMRRSFVVPDDRRFGIEAEANLSQFATDDEIDRALGLPQVEDGGITATSAARLGPAETRAYSAFDGDPGTAWRSPFGAKRGRVNVRLPRYTTIDRLDLQLVADGRHSLPARLLIVNNSGERRRVDVPLPDADAAAGGILDVPVTFQPLQGKGFRITIEKVRPAEAYEVVMPMGIAEMGVPGVVGAPVPETLPGRCLRNLIRVDGEPFPVRVGGSAADAVAGRALSVEPCGEPSVRLAPGEHEVAVTMAPRNGVGIDVGRVVLASGAGGGPTSGDEILAAGGEEAPTVRVVSESPSAVSIEAEASEQPYWLVLGQSQNDGWVASVNGRSLGSSELVDGYANGWRIDEDGPARIELRWEPQATIDRALVVSGLSALACLVLVGVAWWRRRRPPLPTAPQPCFGTRVRAAARGRSARMAAVAAPAVLAVLLARPWVGLVVGLASFAALRYPLARRVLRLAPGLLMLAVAVGITTLQLVKGYPPRFDWPTFFARAADPVWLALFLLLADVALGPAGDPDEGGAEATTAATEPSEAAPPAVAAEPTPAG